MKCVCYYNAGLYHTLLNDLLVKFRTVQYMLETSQTSSVRQTENKTHKRELYMNFQVYVACFVQWVVFWVLTPCGMI